MYNLILNFLMLLKLFRKNNSGQIAIMLGIVMLPMSAFIGAGIDWSQKISASSKLQSSMDSAILAVARQLAVNTTLSTQEMQSIATTVFDANLNISDNVSLQPFQISLTGEVLEMSLTGSIDTAFMKLLNVNKMDIKVESEVNIKFRGVDLALAVDLSGSMYGNKITQLRAATHSLIDELAKAAVTEMRVSFIPWTRGVNLGDLHDEMAVAPPPPPACYWRYSHYYGYYEYCPPAPVVNDCIDAPSSGLIANSNPTVNHPDTSSCPSSELVPLTDLAKVENGQSGKVRLKNIASTWGASGGTGSHLGMYWAWTTLNNAFWDTYETSTPEEPEAIKKYAIIMTDGENNHSSFNTRMIATCDAMKEEGIYIYAIVLMQTSSSVLNTFQDCASPDTAGRNFFIQTNSAAQLTDDFEQIAQEIGQFYLSK